MNNITLRPLYRAEDVKNTMKAVCQEIYDNQDKYSNLDSLIELVNNQISKLELYAPEFYSRTEKEYQAFVEAVKHIKPLKDISSNLDTQHGL